MADIVHAKDLRPGMTYLNNGNIFLVLENTFNKTSMAKAVIKCRVKNLRTGYTLWETLSEDKYEKADITTVPMVYSYNDGNSYVFMDSATYETIEIPAVKLEWEKKFINDGMQIKVRKYGDEILDIAIPDQVNLSVVDCEEAVKGNTVSNVEKKAWTDTGLEVQVPQFIKKGDKIIVNTNDGKYVGRTK